MAWGALGWFLFWGTALSALSLVVVLGGEWRLRILVGCVVVGAMAWGLRSIWRDVRALRRYERICCPECGYDLRTDFSAGCPECGWQRERTEGAI